MFKLKNNWGKMSLGKDIYAPNIKMYHETEKKNLRYNLSRSINEFSNEIPFILFLNGSLTVR